MQPKTPAPREVLLKHLLGHTDSLGHMIANNMAPYEGCDDWQYRDIPWIDIHHWRQLLDEAGDKNFKIIAFSQMGSCIRGQFWVSPEGCDALKVYAERVLS